MDFFLAMQADLIGTTWVYTDVPAEKINLPGCHTRFLSEPLKQKD